MHRYLVRIQEKMFHSYYHRMMDLLNGGRYDLIMFVNALLLHSGKKHLILSLDEVNKCKDLRSLFLQVSTEIDDRLNRFFLVCSALKKKGIVSSGSSRSFSVCLLTKTFFINFYSFYHYIL